jgi:hypothetical protein
MIKAVAITSRRRSEEPTKITELKSYLEKVFRRLVLAEMRKGSTTKWEGEEIESSDQAQSEHEIERDILIREIMARADEWTKGIFEWRILGHSWQEIAPKYGMQANHLRSQWSKKMSTLRRRVEREKGWKQE